MELIPFITLHFTHTFPTYYTSLFGLIAFLQMLFKLIFKYSAIISAKKKKTKTKYTQYSAFTFVLASQQDEIIRNKN